MIAIGEAAQRSAIHIETIRHYEREAVVPAPGRTAGGRVECPALTELFAA